MRLVIAAVIALPLAACMGTSAEQMNPSQFTPEEHVAFEGKPLEAYCQIISNRVRTYTPADRAVVAKSLKKRGFKARDIELITTGDFGTGMTFAGLKCVAPYISRINESFYPGIGHQWQVVYGDQYVYLEGNGTEAGMRVTSWN